MKIAHFLAAILIAVPYSSCLHASVITDVTSFIVNFTDAGFKAPSIIMNETETTFDLSITGGLVDHTFLDDTGSFTSPFVLNWWRGSVTFSQVDTQLFHTSDSVTASIQIYHQAGVDRPHPGDALKGGIFTFPAKTLLLGNPPVHFSGVEGHPGSHSDTYKGDFSVSGADYGITGWTFTTQGAHVPEPSMMFIGSFLGLGGFIAKRRTRKQLV